MPFELCWLQRSVDRDNKHLRKGTKSFGMTKEEWEQAAYIILGGMLLPSSPQRLRVNARDARHKTKLLYLVHCIKNSLNLSQLDRGHHSHTWVLGNIQSTSKNYFWPNKKWSSFTMVSPNSDKFIFLVHNTAGIRGGQHKSRESLSHCQILQT